MTVPLRQLLLFDNVDKVLRKEEREVSFGVPNATDSVLFQPLKSSKRNTDGHLLIQSGQSYQQHPQPNHRD